MSQERSVGDKLRDAVERLPSLNRPAFFGLLRTLRNWLELEAARLAHHAADAGNPKDRGLLATLLDRIKTAGTVLPPATAARAKRLKTDAASASKQLTGLKPVLERFELHCRNTPALRDRTAASLLAEYAGDSRAQSRLRARLAKAGADAATISAIDSAARLKSDDLARLVGGKTVAALIDEAPGHLEQTTRSFDGQPDENVNITIEGEEVPLPTPGPYRLLILLVIGAIVIIVEGVKIAIHATDDRRVRERFAALNCQQINALDDTDISDSIKVLIGAVDDAKGEVNITSNADEQAIIRIFGCLNDLRLRSLVPPLELDLLPEFQGPEFTQLVKRLLPARALEPANWNDALVRRFINDADSATKQALTADDAHALFRQLFEGWTGEIDEGSVVKLLAALPAATVRSVAALPGTKRANFRDELNFKDRKEALNLLDRAGVP